MEARQDILRIDGTDNVGVATTNLVTGTCVRVGDDEVVLRDDVSSGHKVALRRIPRGESIIKYGEVVGRAIQAIDAGSHVGVQNVASLRFRRSGDVAKSGSEGDGISPAVRASVDRPLRVPTLRGFRRVDGRVGVRNHVLVLSAVACANVVVDGIARNLPLAAAITHSCGCPQIGADLDQTIRVLEGHAQHPNVGATLLVGLGCESVPVEDVAASLRREGFVIEVVMIQKEGGVSKAIGKGISIGSDLCARVLQCRRTRMTARDLIVGTECGGSDAWSGITANPLIGAASDRVVSVGGTVILSEVTEFIGAEHVLSRRAASPAIRGQLLGSVVRREKDAAKQGSDLRGGQPTLGNIAGGLSTIEEKSMGAISKGGTTPIREVIGYGHRPTCRGLVVMDTPGSDIHSVTAMVAGGAQVVLFSTGRGTPTGSPIAPVIKIASNSTLYATQSGDLDFDAGRILTGEDPGRVADELWARVVATVNGELTASERLGARDFSIETLGLRL